MPCAVSTYNTTFYVDFLYALLNNIYVTFEVIFSSVPKILIPGYGAYTTSLLTVVSSTKD